MGMANAAPMCRLIKSTWTKISVGDLGKQKRPLYLAPDVSLVHPVEAWHDGTGKQHEDKDEQHANDGGEELLPGGGEGPAETPEEQLADEVHGAHGHDAADALPQCPPPVEDQQPAVVFHVDGGAGVLLLLQQVGQPNRGEAGPHRGV